MSGTSRRRSAPARRPRDLLARAAEAEAVAAQEAEALAIAHGRVRKELAAAIEAAGREDERIVKGIICDPAALARVKRDILACLDWLHLESRLKGQGTGNAQALLANSLGTALSGEGMWNRSVELFDRVLAEAKGKAVAHDG